MPIGRGPGEYKIECRVLFFCVLYRETLKTNLINFIKLYLCTITACLFTEYTQKIIRFPAGFIYTALFRYASRKAVNYPILIFNPLRGLFFSRKLNCFHGSLVIP